MLTACAPDIPGKTVFYTGNGGRREPSERAKLLTRARFGTGLVLLLSGSGALGTLRYAVARPVSDADAG